MFRTFLRSLSPNPLDSLLKKAKKRGKKRFLLAWNRGLGDIALGLYAICQRIREKIPEAEITFLIRQNLKEGFSLLPGVKTLIAPNWKRGEPYEVEKTLKELQIKREGFDIILEKPNPTYWVKWQLGKVTPKLRWKPEYDTLATGFSVPKDKAVVGVQVNAETSYGLWRNWPEKNWHRLFLQTQKTCYFLLFGFQKNPIFPQENVIDLRGKTSLYQMLSLIKNRCQYLVAPDSGVLSMTYYLEAFFPIKVISLWADPNQGILKQKVDSPNPGLEHIPLIGAYRDLSTISVEEVRNHLD